MEFAIGGLAAVSAGFFTNPIQVSKAHLKVQKDLKAKGHPHAKQYKNVFHAGYLVGKKQGVLALQKGLYSSLWMHLIKYGTKLGTYNIAATEGFTKDENGNIIVAKSILICGLAGLAGQVMSTPMYVIRTLLQTEAAKGNHDISSMVTAVKHLYALKGIKGLFKGISTSVPYAFIGTSQLTSFGYTKQLLNEYETFREDKLLTATIASTVGATVLSFFMTPFDLVVTQYQNQPTDDKGNNLRYSSYWDCMKKIYRVHGGTTFVRDFGPMFVKIGPHTILCLVFWDGLKHVQENYSDRIMNYVI